ncbi:MAG: thioredoxin family protein [Nitrososphaerales archaeon]
MQDVNSVNWDEVVLKTGKLTLVEFWAPWCPWCKRLTPLLKEIEGDYEGRIVFTMLNTEEYPDIASKYGVMSLPTMKFFCGGREVAELVGYMPGDMLKQEFDKILSKYRDCLAQSSYIK